MRPLANRLGQRLSDRPSKFEALTNGTRPHATQLSPYCYWQTPLSQSKNAVISFVSSLFFSGCPAAVFRRVPLRVVNAVNRMFGGGALAHIFEKCDEGFLPACTDKNAATSIVAISSILEIVAALEHMPPNYMFGTLAHRMFGVGDLSPLFLETAATLRVPPKQILGANYCSISADAAAQPSKFLEFSFDWFERCKSSELLLGKVSKTHALIIGQEVEKRQCA